MHRRGAQKLMQFRLPLRSSASSAVKKGLHFNLNRCRWASFMLSGCLTHLRDGKWLGLAAAFLVACGCAKIPKAQLNAYVSTVGEAEQAGRTVLSDWRSARAEFERRESVNNSDGGPATPFPLERPIPPAGQALLSAEDTRELAWE